MIRTSDKFQIGKAGEHMVCADLLLKGLNVSMSGETLPYDILLDTGNSIIKIQVKTTSDPKTTNQWKGVSEAYVFSIKRKGSDGLKKYEDNEVDVFAIVSLDTMQIGYIENKDMKTTINIRVDRLKGSYHDEKGIKKRDQVINLNKKGIKIKEICKETGLGETSVRNYLNNNYTPFVSEAKYMSDLSRDKGWFERLKGDHK